ncbi:Fc.00g004840.m01.CDS01 [Cosmosporella sp. VM-42]
MVEVSEFEFVTVKSTLPKYPFPPNHERPIVRTERLILRPFKDDDLETIHALRSQPEVMIWTTQGKPDADIEATKKNFSNQLPPHDIERLNCAICLAETGECIGMGGSHIRDGELGWPVLGYMLRKEAWGKGYATEFVKGFLDIWWALPREKAEVKVDKSTVRGDGDIEEELFTAVTLNDNHGSNNVMRKSGFVLTKAWEEEDLRELTKSVTLYGWKLQKPVQ